MKGAIGNALILNIVITFIGIFFTLLIGSMAYSKAHKTKNYIVNVLDNWNYVPTGATNSNNEAIIADSDKQQLQNLINPYLSKIGYTISSKSKTCPTKESYSIVKNTEIGDYEYCVYQKIHFNYNAGNSTVLRKYNYMVLVYMKLDLPVIGQFLKIPITGETKTYTDLK